VFVQIATFLVDNLVAFFVVLLLVRFHFQWLRVGFRNPVGEFILATTSWVVLPLRRVIPGLAGLDLATLLAAWLLQTLGLWLHALLLGAEPGVGLLLGAAAVELLRYSVYILIFAVFIQALLSWVNPEAPVMPVFNAVTRPFLRPLRRFIPPVGRVDLTPLVLLLILWVLLMLIDGAVRAILAQ
jgi:YggT family protein